MKSNVPIVFIVILCNFMKIILFDTTLKTLIQWNLINYTGHTKPKIL